MPDLAALESAARAAVSRLTPAYRLNLIISAEAPTDVTLGFTYQEEVWGETIFVDFQHGNVIAQCVAD